MKNINLETAVERGLTEEKAREWILNSHFPFEFMAASELTDIEKNELRNLMDELHQKIDSQLENNNKAERFEEHLLLLSTNENTEQKQRLYNRMRELLVKTAYRYPFFYFAYGEVLEVRQCYGRLTVLSE